MNMQRFAKRTLTTVLAAVLALTATGCQQQASNSTYEAKIETVENTATDVQLYCASSVIPSQAEWSETGIGSLANYVESSDSGIKFKYQLYSYANADVTYDEACTARIQDNIGDDILFVNPDVIMNTGRAGLLTDLSDVEGIDHLLPAIKSAVTINGQVLAFPHEYLAYGLIVNNDVLKAHGLEMPTTPEEFLACCEKLKADGMETPIAANRWWLECFVLTQGLIDFYQADDIDQRIADLNSGAAQMSDYLRPGFEFLQTCIDNGYINAAQAASYEAFYERDAYLAQESAFMISYVSAVTGAGRELNSYDFDLQVVGFPTHVGQVALINFGGLVIPTGSENQEAAKKAMSLLCSAEGQQIFCNAQGSFPARDDVTTEVTSMPVLAGLMDDINADRAISAVNSAINMELWGNTCTVVQELLAGASVEACMAHLDQMQAEANAMYTEATAANLQ